MPTLLEIQEIQQTEHTALKENLALKTLVCFVI